MIETTEYEDRVREVREAGASLRQAHEQAHREQADRELAAWRSQDPERH